MEWKNFADETAGHVPGKFLVAAAALGRLDLGSPIIHEMETAFPQAYGAGAPYYFRTTNLDKWVDPVPYLILVDLIVLGIAVIAIRFSLKSPRSSD